MVKVLMLSWEYGGRHVGFHLENLVGRLISKGYDVHTLHLSGDEYKDVRWGGITYTITPNIKTNLHIITSVFSSLGDYARAISSVVYDAGGFDLIHAHGLLVGLHGLMAKLAYGKPLLLTLYSLEEVRRDGTNLISLAIEGFERHLCDLADALVVNDKGLCKRIAEKYEIPWEKIHVLNEWDGIVDVYKEVLKR
ncbi:MAG: glycosyltransferase [Candidatus Methylarchaceae archaeon HK02M1]|nr:glycosyltransferase [Candidatus Methylarchaceae archaeon HK01M]MCP8312490.1 glycosyltransferase [Candidatus Methylarchaceae archaeon HK02M1]